MPALLPGERLRDGPGRGEAGRAEAAHQRLELRALQDLRHRRSLSDHHLGHARRRRRPELQEPVGGNGFMRPARGFILCGLLITLAGCAATGFQAVSPTMPAAKAGLQPEYRIFYDALEEYGDWTLIEPYGYVFRPRVSFVAWQPYQEGFWVPSDVWGWVWISSEPFGWATYHYGKWMFDRFEGWVWIPGLDWGPAWVSWQVTDAYAGWAPIGPRGVDLGGIPGGGYTYVPLGQLASTNLKSAIVPAEEVAAKVALAKPANNSVVKNGITINRGPRFDMVERASGPLTRIKLAEIVPGAKRGGTAAAGAGAPATSIDEQIEATRRAAKDAARQAQTIAETGGAPPARLSIVRPVLTAAPAKPPATGSAPGHGKASAAPDTTR